MVLDRRVATSSVEDLKPGPGSADRVVSESLGESQVGHLHSRVCS